MVNYLILNSFLLQFLIKFCSKKGETTQMPYYVSEQLISFVDVNGYGGSSVKLLKIFLSKNIN